ncbi:MULTISPECIES: GMC oxidoreductase [Calothrix]|uniref:GMC oxidoreductase n=1 Tax=Calothrix TaxID=1186 RepID=UPI0018EFCA79|nr:MULTISPECIES: GMC oxidoreductase [Calothrix]
MTSITERYDIIITGTGAGGGTLAHHLAPTGKKILVLERGDFLEREQDNWNPQEVYQKFSIYPSYRFGTDPKTFILALNCRTHDVENLYVLDSSLFPSNSGTNPTLTIMANALRIGDCIAERLK